ncbi:MAG: porin family protein [Bacteroidota bacterium]
MQKPTNLLALLFLLAFTFSAHTQSIGPKVGVNIGSWGGDDIFDDADYGSITGLQFGAVAVIPVSDKFAIQPELVYLQKGSSFEFDFLGDKIESNTTLNYLEIPILARINVTDGPTQIFINAGPSIGFGLSGTISSESGGEESEVDIDFDEDGISSFDFGLAVGAGVQLEVGPGQIFFDVRYLLGLANLDDSEPEDEQIDVFNRGIGASVGFLFPIGQ